MKDFLGLARDRYSVRKFKKEEVPQEVIEKIVEAGMVAPTGCNNQPQRIFVVKSKEGLEKIYECTRCHFEAPLIFIIGYNKDECWYRPYDKKSSGDIDASIVTTHMMLEAWEQGIGSCWVMLYRPEKLKEAFDLPENFESTALLVMGYPSEEAAPLPLHEQSKNVNEIVRYF